MFVFVMSTHQIFWVTMHMIVCASYDHIVNILRRGTNFPPCSVVYQTQARHDLWLTGSLYNWYTHSWQPQIFSHAETVNKSSQSLETWHRNTSDAEELAWQFWVYLEPVWMCTWLYQPYCDSQSRMQQRCIDMLKDPGQTLYGYKRKCLMKAVVNSLPNHKVRNKAVRSLMGSCRNNEPCGDGGSVAAATNYAILTDWLTKTRR